MTLKNGADWRCVAWFEGGKRKWKGRQAKYEIYWAWYSPLFLKGRKKIEIRLPVCCVRSSKPGVIIYGILGQDCEVKLNRINRMRRQRDRTLFSREEAFALDFHGSWSSCSRLRRHFSSSFERQTGRQTEKVKQLTKLKNTMHVHDDTKMSWMLLSGQQNHNANAAICRLLWLWEAWEARWLPWRCVSVSWRKRGLEKNLLMKPIRKSLDFIVRVNECKTLALSNSGIDQCARQVKSSHT